jgi:hypothetical protein
MNNFIKGFLILVTIFFSEKSAFAEKKPERTLARENRICGIITSWVIYPKGSDAYDPSIKINHEEFLRFSLVGGDSGTQIDSFTVKRSEGIYAQTLQSAFESKTRICVTRNNNEDVVKVQTDFDH